MTQAPIPLTTAFASLLISGAGTPGLAHELDDSFEITHGDTVSDGVPGAGAGNIEVGGAADEFSFQAQPGDLAVFEPLSKGGRTFRWSLKTPGGAVLFDTSCMDRSEVLPETGTYVLTVYGATPTTVGTYSFRLGLTPFSVLDEKTGAIPAEAASAALTG